MADDPFISSRVQSSGPSGVDVLKDLLGMGAPRARGGADLPPQAKQGAFGGRGQRMLPADYPSEQLDRNAQRGTYLDILV